jgi:ATP-binding cassette subfamily B protein
MTRVDKINSVVQQNLISIRVVKAYVRSKYEKDKFKLSNDELRDSAIFAEKY